MKTFAYVLFAITFSFSAFAFIGMIEEADLELEQSDRQLGPAIASAPDAERQWESYNQWQCFDLQNVFFECALYDEEIKVPSITVYSDDAETFFDVHLEDNLDCNETLYNWRQLVDGGDQICIYAAKMQNTKIIEDTGETSVDLWYLTTVKGNNGYWSIY